MTRKTITRTSVYLHPVSPQQEDDGNNKTVPIIVEQLPDTVRVASKKGLDIIMAGFPRGVNSMNHGAKLSIVFVVTDLSADSFLSIFQKIF